MGTIVDGVCRSCPAGAVLSVADGAGTAATARRLGLSRPTVIKWRDRFSVDGVVGLDDQPRSCRPKTIDDAANTYVFWAKSNLQDIAQNGRFAPNNVNQSRIPIQIATFAGPPQGPGTAPFHNNWILCS